MIKTGCLLIGHCSVLTCPKCWIAALVFLSCDILSSKSSGRTKISSSWRSEQSWRRNDMNSASNKQDSLSGKKTNSGEALQFIVGSRAKGNRRKREIAKCHGRVATVLYCSVVEELTFKCWFSHLNSDVSLYSAHPRVEQTGWDVSHTLPAGRPAPLQCHWRPLWPTPPVLWASSLVNTNHTCQHSIHTHTFELHIVVTHVLLPLCCGIMGHQNTMENRYLEQCFF